MKLKLKNFVIISALGLQLLAVSSAFSQEDIYTAPLFVNDQSGYNPISEENIELEKIRALKEGDSKAMYVLGMMYRDGMGVDSDIIQAQEWFLKAAELGHSDSMVELARIYSLDKEFTGIDKDRVQAERWIREAEKRNNAKALYALGDMHEDGFPVEKSHAKSVEYYKKAAFRGIINAYVKLYMAYQYGKGVEQDIKKAIYWLRKIKTEAPEGKIKEYAKQMLSDAYFEIALKEKNPALKFKILNLSWSEGNRYAIEAIGDMFQAGSGVKQSYTSAIVAYETAIKKYESVYAMERLGFIYLKGPAEINRDYKKAFELFTKAADLGGVTASYELGYMYYYGIGVDKNPQEAAKWFDRSKSLAAKKQGPKFSYSTPDSSSNEIQSIISNATERDIENQRQKGLKQQIDNTDQSSGQMPQIDELPKF